MISLYNGRIIVERRLLSENWRAKFRLPNRDETIIDLCTPDVREAYIRAQYHYVALLNNEPFEKIEETLNKKAKCWSCIHWLPRGDKCSFGFPEARQNKGRFAARCELYDDGKGSTGANGQGRWTLD
jgi:hypothetical protein